MSEATETSIYKIAEYNMSRLEEKVGKMNKRAVKIGCDPIRIVIHATNHIPDPRLKNVEMFKIPTIRVHDVEIVGTGPKIEGYKFVGTLDHYTLPGKVFVNAVPGESVPAQFYDAPALCNHCDKIRRRIETFIVEKEEDNTFLQVGRNCLRDFFGHDVTSITRWLSNLIDLVTNLEDEDDWCFGGGSSGDIYFDSIDLLTNTVAVIRTYGWVPRSASDEDNNPTSGNVVFMMSPQVDSKVEQQRKNFIATVKFDKENDLQEANLAVDWLKEQTSDNEYMHNLKLLEDQTHVPYKMVGYWCSLIAAYQRAMARLELAKRTKKLNEHIGQIKDRIEIQVKCTGIQYTDGYYGTICIHRMTDVDGRSLIWFASSDAKMDKGLSYKVKATIKKHDEYKDWKQTHVSRLSVIEQTEEEK